MRRTDHCRGISNAGDSGADAVQLGQGAKPRQAHRSRQQACERPEQMEISRLRAELARVKMEYDILGKATAYFARGSI